MLEETELLLVVVGFMIAFVLAFGIGANDVANSFGTSVGSKVLSLKSACILATIFEIAGSVLLGGQVSSTIRGGIINPDLFNRTNNGAMVLMYGQVASLLSSCIWLLLATFFKMPVSGSHSIVGATAGFGLVLFGINGIQWMGILRIVISWFISPLLSGVISTFIYFILKIVVLKKEHPLEPALYLLPFFYAVIVIINVFSVLYGGLSIFGIGKIKLWIVLVTSFGAGIVTGLVVFFFVRPYLRKKVLQRMQEIERSKEEGYEGPGETKLQKAKRQIVELYERVRHPRRAAKTGVASSSSSSSSSNDILEQMSNDAVPNIKPESIVLKDHAQQTAPPEVLITDNSDLKRTGNGNVDRAMTDTDVNDGDSESDDIRTEVVSIEDRPEEAQVFSFAQILSAIFGSFVHGANDVSNAIGPVVGLWLVAITGDSLNSAPAPIWILFFGGIGISVGLWMWGRKVMETVGNDLTVITPSSGVCIEVGSAVTVLLASNLGIPISTTHCKVGSVVCVGRFRAKSNVNWKLFINIVIAWVVTLPVSAGLSALIMYAFTQTQSGLEVS